MKNPFINLSAISLNIDEKINTTSSKYYLFY